MSGRAAEARTILEGSGLDHPLSVKLPIRNIAIAGGPAIILVDRLKGIQVDADLDLIESSIGFPKRSARIMRSVSVDDPGQQSYENYACGSERNIAGYCNPELEKQIERQSMNPTGKAHEARVRDRPKMAGRRSGRSYFTTMRHPVRSGQAVPRTREAAARCECLSAARPRRAPLRAVAGIRGE